jgi:hypothetical protein
VGQHVEKMEPDSAIAVIEMLVGELNAKFMTDLGEICSMESASDSEQAESSKELRLIFVGGSHADRMAAAAERLGIENVNLSVPGFRVRDDTVEQAIASLQEAVDGGNYRDIIVYQLLDNNVFFEAREDGSRALPSRSKDDQKYHINGRLEYADHAVIKNLVNTITPLLRAGGDKEKWILSPLPRYIKRCCKDKGHLTNKKDDDYASKMGESLSEIRDSMKDLIYGKRIKAFKVLLTTKLVMGDDEDDAAENIRRFWREDAVHMTTEGYDTLVTALSNLASTAAFKRPVKQDSASGGRGVKRKQWVSEDDTLAHRTDDKRQNWPRGRGRGRGRGGQSAEQRGGGSTAGRGWHPNPNKRGGGRFWFQKRGGRPFKY